MKGEEGRPPGNDSGLVDNIHIWLLEMPGIRLSYVPPQHYVPICVPLG